MLEVIRLEGHSLGHENAFISGDIHLLQVTTSVDDYIYAKIELKTFS